MVRHMFISVGFIVVRLIQDYFMWDQYLLMVERHLLNYPSSTGVTVTSTSLYGPNNGDTPERCK